MHTGSIIRRILIRLVLAFSQPPPNAAWYRRFLPLLVLVAVIAGAVVVWTTGTTVLVDYVNNVTGTPSTRTVGDGVRASLVVAWIATVGFALAFANLVIAPLRRNPLVVAIPATLYSWLTGMTAVGIGLLIGTSIFK